MRGGKSDQLVVEVASLLAGQTTQAADSAAIHPAEPAGLADTAAFGDVLQDRLDPLGRQPGVEQGRPLPLGEASLAGPAAEHASLPIGAVATGHRQISGPAIAVLGALRIQTAEAREVVHGVGSPRRSSRLRVSCALLMG